MNRYKETIDKKLRICRMNQLFSGPHLKKTGFSLSVPKSFPIFVALKRVKCVRRVPVNDSIIYGLLMPVYFIHKAVAFPEIMIGLSGVLNVFEQREMAAVLFLPVILKNIYNGTTRKGSGSGI
jgi:hypothetical protein